MFEVGFSEIILILGLALLVLGPEKLPGLAAKVGRWTGRARAMARQLRTQLEQEVTMEEMTRSRPMQSSSAQTDHSINPNPHQSEPSAHSAAPRAGTQTEPNSIHAPAASSEAAPTTSSNPQ